MASDYRVDESNAEREAVERWENEGGKGPKRHHTFGPAGGDHQRHICD